MLHFFVFFGYLVFASFVSFLLILPSQVLTPISFSQCFIFSCLALIFQLIPDHVPCISSLSEAYLCVHIFFLFPFASSHVHFHYFSATPSHILSSSVVLSCLPFAGCVICFPCLHLRICSLFIATRPFSFRYHHLVFSSFTSNSLSYFSPAIPCVLILYHIFASFFSFQSHFLAVFSSLIFRFCTYLCSFTTSRLLPSFYTPISLSFLQRYQEAFDKDILYTKYRRHEICWDSFPCVREASAELIECSFSPAEIGLS